MTRNRLLIGLMAATMLYAGPPAIAAPAPAPAASAAVEDVARERANQIIGAMNEIGDAFKSVDRNAIQAGKTPQEKAAIMEAQVVIAQRSIDLGLGKLRAMQPLAGDAEIFRTMNQVLVDGRVYGERVQDVVGAMREVAQAMRTGDRARMEKSLAVMKSGTVAMLEGQAIMYRSRKVFFDKGSSDACQLDASAYLYEGMASLSKAALDVAPAAQVVQPLRAAGHAAQGAVADGRARLKIELANTAGLSAADRRVLASNGALQAQIFDSMTESAAILARAADRLEKGDVSQLQADIAALGAEEDRQQTLTVQQINAT